MATVKFDSTKRKPFTKEQLKRFEELSRQPDSKIDFSDIPELDEDWFRRAQAAAKASVQSKVPVALRLDADVLEWFRAQGKGYQSQINAILRAYTEAHRTRKLSRPAEPAGSLK